VGVHPRRAAAERARTDAGIREVLARVAPELPITEEDERFAASLEQIHRESDEMMWREQLDRAMARRPSARRPPLPVLRSARPRAHARRRRAVVGRRRRAARSSGRSSDDPDLAAEARAA
jgi:hypothetical protein